MKLQEILSPEQSKKVKTMVDAMIDSSGDKLFKRYGKDAEKVAYGRAINVIKKQQQKQDMNINRITELVKASLSKNTVNETETIKPDQIDIISMDVPLFIRILEYSREDAETDMDLHVLAEKAIEMTKQQGILQMDDYDSLVGDNSSTEINENKLLKTAKLSSTEYQKAKKLKGFDEKNYTWDSKQQLYIKK